MLFPVLNNSDLRASGLHTVGEIPWGTHLSQFFRTREDLIDVLVPYFKAGLEANESCLWITAEPLQAAEATAALRAAVPELPEFIERGQIEILDYREWYLRSNSLTADEVLRGWLAREAQARACGFEGLRVTGNTMFLERERWEDFAAYESSVHRAFHSQRILALCSYSLEKCTANDIIDVLRNHRFALVRRDGQWESIQSATQVLAAVKADVNTTGQAMPTTPRSLIERETPAAPAHAVRFYECDAYPAEDIARHLHGALAGGGAGLLYATQPHTRAILSAVAAHGVDVEAAHAAGRLITRDAAELSVSVLNGAEPDEAAFHRFVGADVEALLSTYPKIHAYGEIVDVLASNGQHKAALKLESWWNQLLATREIALLCGYALDNFGSADSVSAFKRVCRAHADVEPISPSQHTDHNRAVADVEQLTLALKHETDERERIEREKNRLRQAEQRSREHARTIDERLARLQELTSSMSEATTLADIGRAVVLSLCKTFGADLSAFWVRTEDDNLALLGHSNTRSPDKVPITTDADSPVGRAIRLRRPVWLTRRDEIAEQAPEVLRQFPNAGAIGYLPLTLRDYCLGAIALVHKSSYDENPTARALLEDYTKQIALAVDRARSFEDAHRARARLQLLADAGRRIAHASLDFRHILENLVDEVTRTRFADGCTVCLRDIEGDMLSLVALNHVVEERAAIAARMLRDAPVKLGQGIVGTVAQTGTAMRLTSREEVLSRFNPAYLAYIKQSQICTLLAVPLLTPDGVVGVIVATRDYPSVPYSAEDEQFLQELADRSALSIQNARLYDRAQRERERAEAANAAKDEFLAMLGHELRNPLSPILTASQLMRLRGGDLLAKERTIIERQVHHMVRLVDDLLDVSRITRGKIELKRTPIEIVQIVANAVEVASPLLEERRHRLITAVPSAGLLVDADAARLAQVIANLLHNAAKYTPPDGTIRVSAGARDGKVHVVVRDNGVGIDPDLLPRIFDLFAQGKQESDRAKGGLGLGLAIARSLCELHGGKLRARSDGPGKGSEFTLELPLSESADASTEAQDNAADESAATRFRILIVDDNADAADSLGEVLEMLGHSTRTAYDGPSALRIVENFRPQLALLDIGLPAMDGYELAQRLREQLGNAAPKLVALTGYGQATDRHRSAQAGFDHHLVKPLDFDRLQTVIEELFPTTVHH